MSAYTPPPIDPADIRPGDVVPAYLLKATKSVLADRERELLNLKGPCSSEHCILHYAHVGPCDIHRPDPDAEAVEALAKVMHDDRCSDEWCDGCDMGDYEHDAERIIHSARERGWDVVRRAES